MAAGRAPPDDDRPPLPDLLASLPAARRGLRRDARPPTGGCASTGPTSARSSTSSASTSCAAAGAEAAPPARRRRRHLQRLRRRRLDRRRRWGLDPVPVLLTSDEWAGIERARGAAGRAARTSSSPTSTAPATCCAAGCCPPEVVLGHPGFLRASATRSASPAPSSCSPPPSTSPATATASCTVLADRTQAPSGAGYALENRVVVSRVFPSLYRDAQVHRLAPFFRTLRAGARRTSPRPAPTTPASCVLSPGPVRARPPSSTPTWRPTSATRWWRAPTSPCATAGCGCAPSAGWSRVDVILRRTDAWFCDPLELRPDSQLGVPGLVEACPAGHGVGRQHARQRGAREPRAAAVPAPAGRAPARAAARAAVGADLVVRRRRRASPRAGPPRPARAQADRPRASAPTAVLRLGARPRTAATTCAAGSRPAPRPGSARSTLALASAPDADASRPRGPPVRAARLRRGPRRLLRGHARRPDPGGGSGHRARHLQPDRRRQQGHLGAGLRAREAAGLLARSRAARWPPSTRRRRCRPGRRRTCSGWAATPSGPRTSSGSCGSSTTAATTSSTAPTPPARPACGCCSPPSPEVTPTYPGFARRRRPGSPPPAPSCSPWRSTTSRPGTLAFAVRRLLEAAHTVRDQLSTDTWLVVGRPATGSSSTRARSPVGRATRLAPDACGSLLALAGPRRPRAWSATPAGGSWTPAGASSGAASWPPCSAATVTVEREHRPPTACCSSRCSRGREHHHLPPPLPVATPSSRRCSTCCCSTPTTPGRSPTSSTGSRRTSGPCRLGRGHPGCRTPSRLVLETSTALRLADTAALASRPRPTDGARTRPELGGLPRPGHRRPPRHRRRHRQGQLRGAAAAAAVLTRPTRCRPRLEVVPVTLPGDPPHGVPLRVGGVGELRRAAPAAPRRPGQMCRSSRVRDRARARRLPGADRLLRQPGRVLRRHSSRTPA